MVKFKYFRITETEALNDIERYLVSIDIRNKAILGLSDKFGAYECLQSSQGDILAFSFNSTPDNSIWESANCGFMPKTETDELKMIVNLPESIDYQDVIKRYKFSSEISFDEPTCEHDTSPTFVIDGNRKTGFYVIKVCYIGELKKYTNKGLEEITVSEMMRGIE